MDFPSGIMSACSFNPSFPVKVQLLQFQVQFQVSKNSLAKHFNRRPHPPSETKGCLTACSVSVYMYYQIHATKSMQHVIPKISPIQDIACEANLLIHECHMVLSGLLQLTIIHAIVALNSYKTWALFQEISQSKTGLGHEKVQLVARLVNLFYKLENINATYPANE